MIFTTKAEYGVRLLVELGRQGSGQPVSLKAISEAEGDRLAAEPVSGEGHAPREKRPGRLDRATARTEPFADSCAETAEPHSEESIFSFNFRIELTPLLNTD